MLKQAMAWMFAAPKPCAKCTSLPYHSIAWWEARRIPFNFLIGLYGIGCFIAFEWGMSAVLTHGEDAVEPMALIAAPFVINALYTLGWLLEVPCRWIRPSLSPRFGPLLLRTGILLGVILISIPAVIGVGFRLLS